MKATVALPAAPQIRTTASNERTRLRTRKPVAASTPLENKLAALSIIGRRRGLSEPSLSSLAARVGITVMETNRESSTEIEMATAMSRNNCPISSSSTRMGMNTTTVVRADTSTAVHTWLAPRYAASNLDAPSSRRRKIFSRTTIAASTTMPTAKAIPAREMTLIDRPMAAMATKVPITEIGMASEITRVARIERRNNSRVSAASMPPTQIFWRTRSMADLI